ncbi:shufflon system plasmid conjugative transfer pilus tip adhesin PilV [Cupriavidus necator]|uniref:shufflon system plasmid conjugative transfer pilus tip adhesin PilV n=1 Tax=Cupriavidus necator TaxID=106590 RepID=UPI00068EDC17|nr:shufflon system plasmid conjugative transfer pilus tip adhesin PilV [Cupriavidus necator]
MINKRNRRGRRRARGFTLIEMTVTLTIIVSVLGMMWPMLGDYADELVNRSAADQQLLVAKGARKYLDDNIGTVTAGLSGTTPTSIPFATIQNAGYIPAGVSATTPYGQTFNIVVRRPSATATKFEALVVTSGGSSISPKNAQRIARMQRGVGGYIAPSNTNLIKAPDGQWNSLASDFGVAPGAGHIATALFSSDGDGSGDYLWRNAVPGRPELNRMNTAIDMNNQDMNNAKTVTATTVQTQDVNATRATISNRMTTQDAVVNRDNYLYAAAVPGTACSQEASVRRNQNTWASLVVCGYGKWQPVGNALEGIYDGAPCSLADQVMSDVNSRGYICRGGFWRLFRNAFGNMTINRKFDNVTDGVTIGKDYCPGGTAWALYTPKQQMVNVTGNVMPPIQGVYFWLNDYGTYWYAQASAVSPAAWYSGNDVGAIGGQLVGTVTTGCSY